MKQIKIIGCTDSMMWYARRVGETVEYLGEEEKLYWSRDSGGYKNIVYKEDAQLIHDQLSKQEIDVVSTLTRQLEIMENQLTMLRLRVDQLEMAKANSNPFYTHTIPPWRITYHPDTSPQSPWTITCKTPATGL